jgi:hypothetical protein
MVLFLTNEGNEANARRDSVVHEHPSEQPWWDLSLSCLLDDKQVVDSDVRNISYFKMG